MYDPCKELVIAVVLRAIDDYKMIESGFVPSVNGKKEQNISAKRKWQEEQKIKSFFESIGKPEWYKALKRRFACPNCYMWNKKTNVCEMSLYFGVDNCD